MVLCALLPETQAQTTPIQKNTIKSLVKHTSTLPQTKHMNTYSPELLTHNTQYSVHIPAVNTKCWTSSKDVKNH